MKSIQRHYFGQRKANIKRRFDALVLLRRHGKLIHRQFKKQRAFEPWQKKLQRRLSVAAAPLLVIAMLINLFLPAITARAEETLTWTNGADFAFNKVGGCRSTDIDKLTISGNEYTDPTCIAATSDSDIKLAPDESDMQGVVGVSAGLDFSLALKNDGTVWAWGRNTFGQMGQGQVGADEKFPLQVKNSDGQGFLADVKSIDSGQNFSLALKNDGTVWAWGYGGDGRLGNGSQTSQYLPTPVLKGDNTGPLEGVTAISTGAYHSLALKNDGTVWAWGNGSNGRLGVNSTLNNYKAVQVKDSAGTGYLTGVTGVFANYFQSFALRNDGTVWGWGYNNSGALGDNTTVDKNLPTQVKDSAGTGFLSGITQLSGGVNSALALKNDGTVWGWGYNGNGNIGDGTNTARSLPTQTKDSAGTGFLSGITKITSSNGGSFVLKDDGTVLGWGYNSYGEAGANGGASVRLFPTPVIEASSSSPLQGIVGIVGAEGANFTLAITADGMLYGWGRNVNGQIGFRRYGAMGIWAAVTVVSKVEITNLSDISKVDVGESHTLALKNDGTVWAWGDNGLSQLGNGVTGGRQDEPVQVKDSSGNGYLSGIIEVSADRYHSLALRNDGTVWAWGSGSNYALGDGTTTNRSLPVQVKNSTGAGFLTGITKIVAGFWMSMALRDDGTVWAWGNNEKGQLGTGDINLRSLPTQVKDSAGTGFLGGVTDIGISNSPANTAMHSVALRNDGTVWAWGNNTYGEVGDGTNTNRSLPTQVKDSAGTGFLGGVTAIASSGYASLALRDDGTVWSWGLGSAIGDGANTHRSLPTQVKDSAGTGFLGGIAKIYGGNQAVFALTSQGDVWAWGNNTYGNLSDNTTTSRYLPVRAKDVDGVSLLTGVSSLSASGRHTMAIKNDGSIWAWGSNATGQLSAGTYVDEYRLPVRVVKTVNYLSGYAASGVLSGIQFDIGQGKKTKWYGVNWNTDSLPAGTSVKFNVRTSNDASTWSQWSQDFVQNTAGTTNGTADIDTLPMSRYIELRATLATTDNAVTPKLNDFSLAYMVDITAPDTNATNIKLSRVQNGAQIGHDGWIDIQTPYISWDEGADDINGSGVQGYCLYLGTDETADFSQTKGILGESPLDTGGKCQYAVTANHIDLSLPGSLSAPLAVANNPYHLLVKAIDNGSNIFGGSAANFTFNYDNTPPTNPVFVSAPSQFVSDKNVTLTWPSTGDQSAQDADSQVAGLQYRIGSEGTWYGDAHNGQQDLTDVLANDGNYQMNQAFDYPLLKEGNNVIYFRTIDRAGNISTSYITAILKLNTSSPSSPLNVTAAPASSSTNAFAFSWHIPASFVGVASGITYCYTVNALPTATNCTYTQPGQTTLATDAYATQPGENIFYVVARDEAGNINYATYGSVAFTANTPAPGLPQNIEIADISSKDAGLWKLAFSWATPADAGAGIAKYSVYRSTDGVNFAQAATTSGLSYVDSLLSQITYYYKVKACDSANNCGAFSDVVSKLPTGRFTTPPELISNVGVEVSTRKASFSWVTDRVSDSRVQYGVSSGDYFAGEVAVSAQLKTHSVDMDNLTAGTTYYYRVKWTDEDGNTGVSSEYTFSTLPAPVIKNVEIVKKTLSSATIKITTMDATKVSLFYGKSENFGGVTSVNTSRSESSYIVELTGLDDGSDYFFKLVTFDADGNQYDSHRIDAFSTPPRPRISNLRFQPVNGEPTSTQSVVWTTNIPANSTVTYGKVGTNGSDVYLSKVSTEHEIILRGLEDDSQYFLMAQSRDADGNLAVSDRQTFKTALDTRAPKISDIRIETAVKGNGSEARGQIVVSWKTDEPATSQVAYAYGSAGTELPNKTGEDAQLSMDHVVIVSDLPVSKVYHLVPISRDKSGNASLGEDRSAVVGRATESVLNIILNSLKGIFGL